MLAGAIGSSGLPDRGTLAVIAIGLIAVAGGSWLASLRLWPYTRRCWRCGGTGQSRGSNSRRYGRCKSCKGKPERLRRGAGLVHGKRWGQ